MDRHIVVGVDGSAPGWAALEWAIAEAAHTGQSLAVCHAVSVGGRLWRRTHTYGDVMSRYDRAVIDRGVRTAAARIGLHRVKGVMPAHDPIDALVALSNDAEMVVVGLRRHTRPTAELWGETALGVIARSSCPVVVACPEPAGSRGPFAKHVVVGTDDDPEAINALAYGFAYADSHSLPLAAVHVAHTWPGDFWVDEEFLEVNFAGSPPILELLAKCVEPLEVEYPKVHVKKSVFGGDPASGLLRAAGKAALLVVGARERRLSTRLLLGSVSRGVLFEAGCPVAIVRGDWKARSSFIRRNGEVWR